ncbi:L,D-transpeptidase family protein [Chitinophaga sp. 212800010-3]|uniref:L,D-transpeptidase family protein n=1 Tax=unclassified Chitinophaga TaxID=2619133 RepID=UPI002DE9F1E3|nr:YkuD domain-containing protein [Chitinophaga sp. 212800010-3]
MKQQLYTVLLISLILSACHSPTPIPGSTYRREISPRNKGITKDIAYNDLFLDSMAMEKFITAQQIDDTIADRLRSFYNVRNYEFAWLGSNGPAEQASAFRSLYNYGRDTITVRGVDIRLDAMMNNDSLRISAKNPEMIRMELLLTCRLINFFKETGRSIWQLEHIVPTHRYPVMVLTDSLLAASNQLYPAVAAMKEPLKKYREYVQQGGWESVPPLKRVLKKGQSSSAIPAIKERLRITNEYNDSDSSELFTDELETAVNLVRNNNGYTQNGTLNDSIVNVLNVPADERLKKLLLNTERMKWMPAATSGRLITVNIPAFMLHANDNNKRVFDMRVVVGKEGHSTTMFSGMLNQVVFSPHWNIPRSIIKREILPAMSRNKNYLSSKNMEIRGERNGMPVIRQRPGPRNALGRVKFLFPNSYNIYFHDTPEKRLFDRDNRAYSHGCIRLKDPLEMATFVLDGMPRWTTERIDTAMNSGKEKFVTVKYPVPVIITYFTAWADQGNIHFANDVYGHDTAFMKKLFR